MINKQSSSGHPYYRKKKHCYDIVEKTINSIINHSVDPEIFTRPCVTHRVLQPGIGECKNRFIYCVPIEITVIEMVFGLDIIFDFQSNSSTPIKLGSTQSELHKYIMKSKRGKNSAAGDYSKFDSTLPKHMLYTSLHLIKSMLELDPYLSRLFDIMATYIVESNIFHPATGFTRRNRGLISGSFFTNLVDSICNWYIVEYSSFNNTGVSTPESLSYSVSGDDSVFFYDKLDFSGITDVAQTVFGMKLNFPDEFRFSQSDCRAHFLGSVFGRAGPVRDIGKMALGAIMTTYK